MSNPFLSRTSLPDFPLWAQMEANRIPASFGLEVTARCNNDCPHCYINLPAGDREAKAKELSLEEATPLPTADDAVHDQLLGFREKERHDLPHAGGLPP